uniref:DOMON domain-containing protein n=2 Tax=Caenorhabditis japonica TaxID=281687 RepID=A0A8R1DFA2_CAEJA
MALTKTCVVLMVLLACAAAKTCKYTQSDFNSHWIFANNSIIVQFQNEDIKNNHWTGLGFGDDKNSFEGVFFMVTNNQVSVRTGHSTENGPPTFTTSQNGNVQMQSLVYFPHDKTMSAVFTIPLNFNGKNLQSCQKWRWIKSGEIENGAVTENSKSPKSKKVCPMECN